MALVSHLDTAATYRAAVTAFSDTKGTLADLEKESKAWAEEDDLDRNGDGTAIQRGLKQYAGSFLDNMDLLPKESMKSAKTMTKLLSEYLESPKKLSGALAQIRDKATHHQPF